MSALCGGAFPRARRAGGAALMLGAVRGLTWEFAIVPHQVDGSRNSQRDVITGFLDKLDTDMAPCL